MERRLKERLTGAAVLVMLAVIFIPMVLDNSGQDELGIRATNIPPRPEMIFTPPEVPAGRPPQGPENGDPVTAFSTPESGPPSTAEPSDKGSAIADKAAAEAIPAAGVNDRQDGELAAWVVQLGSFSSGDNAHGLARRLQKAGFPAYIDEVRIETGIAYRVRIGPEIHREDAEATLDKVVKALDLKGIVLRHP